MDRADLRALFETFTRGPSILFCGQGVLKQYCGTDLFVSATSHRFGKPEVSRYIDLIQVLGNEPSESVVSILHNISTRIAIPEALQTILDLPWNAVITSCFHDVIDRALQADWRSVDPILTDQRSPPDPRSRTKLHLLKLYGCVTSDRDTEHPPLNEIDLLRRQAVASNLLSRLSELVTPRGVCFIDALTTDDWLDVDKLGEHIAALGKGQAHVFSASEALRSVRTFSLLARMGKLVFHNESLLDIVAEAKAEGVLSLTEQTRTWFEGTELTLRSGRKHVFSAGDWRRLTSGINVLSDTDVDEPTGFSSQDEKYRAFREFLYGTRSTPDWRGFREGFAFRRTHVRPLVDAVQKALESARLQEDPFLLCGQSGVGKTIALADVAFEMRHKRWPVLYFGRNYSDLDYGQIETLCSQLEHLETTATLLIWDSMAEMHAYHSLASHLASRGRKVVVVGSAYDYKKAPRSFELPATMDAQEVKLFFAHLKKIDPKLVEGIASDEVSGHNFLAWLWRLLPETRGPLRTGLLREFETYEQILDGMWATNPETTTAQPGTLGTLLREAGFNVPQSDSTEAMDLKSAVGGEASKVERLSGLILIPARYGLDVPVDLILRCLGKEGFEILRTALQNVPVYRWNEDEQGNQLLGARLRLEADIIARARFRRTEENELLKVLIENVRPPADWQAPNSEIDFVERLLRAAGPESELRKPTSEELVLLADAIAEMMANNANRSNPRLLFQEGHLRREAILRKKESLSWEDPEQLSIQVDGIVHQYEQAVKALSTAEIVRADASARGNQRNTRSLSYLHTEFATLYGLAQELHYLVSSRQPNSRAHKSLTISLQQGFNDAVRHCNVAVMHDSENAHPADVRFRVTKVRLENDGNIPADERLNLVAELCDVLEMDCWRSQTETYERRRLELANVLGDDTLKQQALLALEKAGSLAGEYFIAWNGIYYADHTFRTKPDIVAALERIESLGERARRDLRMVRLYTRTWWHIFGNPDVFSPDSERATARLNREQWEYCADWLRQRLGFQEETSLQTQFLYAWALFQTGRYGESDDKFRELDRELAAGRYRVVRLAVWCDSNGAPVPCQGVVRRIIPETDKGWVYVPAIRREISFQPNDFRDQAIKPNEPIRDFYISFNFRGPIADPARFFKRDGRTV